MAISLTLLPGSTIRWNGRCYVIVDYAGLDEVIARQPGKSRLERIPVKEAESNHLGGNTWTAPDLASVSEEDWRDALRRFEALKPILAMDHAQRTLADVKRTARALGKHPVTIYRWIENYNRTGRLSVFLRKGRSDRGTGRLSPKVENIMDAAIRKIYLKAESPPMTAVIEEVHLQCRKQNIKKRPHANTVRARIATLSDRTKLEKRKGKKAAAEKYEPIKGHFPGADFPLAVAQIDHTPWT